MTASHSRLQKLLNHIPVIFIWCIVAAIGFAKTGPKLLDGSLPGNDDNMRLVQIRDWLGGQGWSDPIQSRLYPPDPLTSHWTRLQDILIGGPIKLLSPLLGQGMAETVVLMAVPLIFLYVGLILAVKLAHYLSDSPWIPLCAAMAMGLCFPVFYQFYPGRIDHHGLQILLALGTALAIIKSDSQVKYAGIAGALCAISLWIGLESAPYVAAACIAIAMMWVLGGQDEGKEKPLKIFAITLFAGTFLCLFITRAPSLWGNACDAISSVILLLTASVSLAMIIASYLAKHLTRPLSRFAALGVLGAVAIGITLIVYPQCIYGPYSQLDPRLTEVWLSNVSEAQPLHKYIVSSPITGAAMVTIPILALFAVLFGPPKITIREKLTRHTAIRTLLIFTIVTALTGFIQMRMLSLAGALGAPLVAAMTANFLHKCDRLKSDISRALGRTTILFVLSPMFLPILMAMFMPVPDNKSVAPTNSDGEMAECTASQTLRALRKLPAGFAITQIDLGAPILVHTKHSVSSAPYHRNEAGNLLALNVFMGSKAEAKLAANSSDADYIISCKTAAETNLYKRLAPNGLLSELEEGAIPNWLTPVEMPAGNPLLVFKIKD